MTKDNKPTGAIKYVDRVRVRSESPVSRLATISVGGIGIPFNKVTITLDADSFARIIIEAPIDEVDIVALQQDTGITLVDATVKQ